MGSSIGTDAELDRIFTHRRDKLLAMRDKDGRRFTAPEIRVMAERPDVDLHDLQGYLDQGCPLDAAREIVL